MPKDRSKAQNWDEYYEKFDINQHIFLDREMTTRKNIGFVFDTPQSYYRILGEFEGRFGWRPDWLGVAAWRLAWDKNLMRFKWLGSDGWEY
ncbi:hypothetical protein VTL71DRAFT_10410 [Oculimacula yallundae]|uniref:Uncharacterized protein n=1 Tax=Oculimacula yallundae TaxID=86028 RepID=A0ABR4CUG1_9HELO